VLGDLLTADMQSRAFIATKVWTRGEREGVLQMTRSMDLLALAAASISCRCHNLLDLDTHLRTLRRWKEEGDPLPSASRITPWSRMRDSPGSSSANRSTSCSSTIRRPPVPPNGACCRCVRIRGVAVIVNRAFDDGGIFARLKDRPLPPWAAETGCTSWAQLLLKFVIAHPAVTCVIPATGKVRNLEDNRRGRAPVRLPDARQRRLDRRGGGLIGLKCRQVAT
jgi:hypothetical protein